MVNEPRREFERFITFIDAIVAIAITLLVLPLVELTAEVDQYTSVGNLIEQNQAELWAFLLSFFVISRFWFIQHATVKHVMQFDPTLASLLITWTLTIVFLPFPTALVAEAPNSVATKALYMGSMFVTILVISATEWYLRRRPALTDGDPRGELDPLSGLTNAVIVLIALGLSLAVPATSYFPLLLLTVAGRVTSWLRRRS